MQNKEGKVSETSIPVTGGRPVYQKGSDYLFFSALSADWFIGSDYNSNRAWLATTSNDNAICPAEASSGRRTTAAPPLL